MQRALWWMRPLVLRTLWREVRLASRLLREPRVPVWMKLVLPAALLYLVIPVDVLPDVIPGLGQMDDLMILYAGLRLFLHLSPAPVLQHHRDAIARRQAFVRMPGDAEVIDAEFRRE